MAQLVIPHRFRGPPDSGNGGYACGTFAALVGDAAEVTLRRPPPLDTPLVAQRHDDVLRVQVDDQVIAEVREAEPDVQVPAAVPWSAAEDAQSRFWGHSFHPFPTCFVCGPERAQDDGLRIFAGRIEGREEFASTWIPHPSLPNVGGVLAPEVVWASLDCPSSSPGIEQAPAMTLLGRLTARVLRPVRIGERYVVVAWHLGIEGRKRHAGSAVLDVQGEPYALARAVWIEIAETALPNTAP